MKRISDQQISSPADFYLDSSYALISLITTWSYDSEPHKGLCKGVNFYLLGIIILPIAEMILA